MKNKGIAEEFAPLSWAYAGGIMLALLLPLLNLPPWFAPPDWGKTMVFRGIVAVLFLFFAWQFLFDSRAQTFIARKRILLPLGAKRIACALSILAGSVAISVAFSVDPIFSLWGDPARSGGFINFLSFILFACAAFLFLSKHTWTAAWAVAIAGGIGVSLIAFFQQFGVFHTFFIWSEVRPPSTIGGSIFLAMYLLLLTFPALSFGIQTKNLTSKTIYFSSAILFLAVIVFIAQARSALLGIGIGFVWFLFAYPDGKKLLKIIALSVIAAAVLVLYTLKTNPSLLEAFPALVRSAAGRMLTLTEGFQADESRISAWKISWNAFLKRPLTGYGPENFAVGFDKTYDPSLPKMAKAPALSQISWWDRAHNMVFDIAVQEGILTLLSYGALFTFIFRGLAQKKREGGSGAIAAHALQASFTAFLAANMFSFDVFSTYLIFFFSVAYALHLTSEHSEHEEEQTAKNGADTSIHTIHSIRKYKYPIFTGILIIVVWSLWKFDILPFTVNTDINRANYFVQKNACEQALRTFDKVLRQEKSFLNTYTRLQYIDALSVCGEQTEGEEKYALIKNGYERFKEAAAFRPTYTRNWILLGKLTNGLADIEKARGDTELAFQLLAESDSYLQKAHALSPKRQEVYVEWIQTEILTEQYEQAKRKSEECLVRNSEFGECWWMKGITELYLQDEKQAENDMNTAVQWGYKAESLISFTQLARAYSMIRDKTKLASTYEKIIEARPRNIQMLSALAVVYRDLRQFDKAREAALKLAEVNPEAKEEVTRFLQTLR